MARTADLDGDLDGFFEQLEAARLPSPSRRRQIREEAGVSLRAGAAALGVEVLTLRRWEGGKRPRSLDAQIAYAEFLDRLSELAQ
jgi:DNA-binding XRE family transcriptional regulator